MDDHKLDDLVGFCLELEADDLPTIDNRIRTLMIMRQMVPGAHQVRPEWAILPVIPCWSGDGAQAIEEPEPEPVSTVRKAAVKAMLPHIQSVQPVGAKLNGSIDKRSKQYRAMKQAQQAQLSSRSGVNDESGKRRLRESVKPADLTSDDINGNLFNPEERRVAMVKLLAKQSPMTPGAIAASLNMDVAKVYNAMCIEPGRSLFQNNTTEGGKELTAKGHQLFRQLQSGEQ